MRRNISPRSNACSSNIEARRSLLHTPLPSLRSGSIWLIAIALFGLCTVLLSGCLESGDGVSINGGDAPPASRRAYPVAPYGVSIGERIDQLSFLNTEGDPITLGDFYSDYQNRLLLVTTSAEWCTACIKEQPKLEALYQQYRERGLNVIVSLFQDSDFSPATPALAEAWRDKYTLSFPILADQATPSTFAPYYDVSLTPMVMLIDVETMEIVYLTQGFDEDQVVAQIETRLPPTIRPSLYPPDPYGAETGAVIEDLTFTQIDGSSLSLSQLYRDHSKRVLLLTTSAEWCTACIKEQPKLEELYVTYGARGLEVMVSMFQDSDFSPATTEVAETWRDKYNLSFFVVADSASPSTLSPYYDVSLTPMVMLIDLEEMRITYISQGFDEDQVRGLLEVSLPSP